MAKDDNQKKCAKTATEKHTFLFEVKGAPKKKMSCARNRERENAIISFPFTTFRIWGSTQYVKNVTTSAIIDMGRHTSVM